MGNNELLNAIHWDVFGGVAGDKDSCNLLVAINEKVCRNEGCAAFSELNVIALAHRFNHAAKSQASLYECPGRVIVHAKLLV
jgi:hypothetical protein